MRFGLVSIKTVSGQPEQNLLHIRRCIREYHTQCDVLCFGESFLQGFSSLLYEPQEDYRLSTKQDANMIRLLQVWAHKYRIAISFGYFEKEDDKIYSSYLFIGDDGLVYNNYRRQSKSFSSDNEVYARGEGLKIFKYKDRSFLTTICDDLRDEAIAKKINESGVDVVLWPIYMSDGHVFKVENIACVEHLKPLVLMINAYDESTKGGGALFKNGKIVLSLAEKQEGILLIDDERLDVIDNQGLRN